MTALNIDTTGLLDKAAQGIKELAVLYAPSIGQLTAAELISFAKAIDAKRVIDARNLLRAKMDLTALAQEKQAMLADLYAMVEANANAWDTGKQILESALKLALALALSVVAL